MNPLMLRQSLKYVLLPGRPPLGSPVADLHNRAFDFWYPFWAAVFKQLGDKRKPSSDDFLRQDLFSLLLHGEEVVALHAYTFFDLKLHAAREHSYFQKSFTEKAMKEIEKSGASTAMSFEYFSVSPEWRSPSLGVSLAATLLCLGFKVFEESRADISLGVCRVDIGVAKMCYDAGGIPLDTNLKLHKVTCDLVGILQGAQRPYKEPAENELAAHFWKNREDLADSKDNRFRRRKVAA